MNYHIISDIPTSLYPQILDMIHLSFEEYKKKGLHFTCSDYQMTDLVRKVMRGNCFVALSDGGDVLGITSVSIFPDESAYENITAISPKAKGLGIGTALFEAYMSRLLSGGGKIYNFRYGCGSKRICLLAFEEMWIPQGRFRVFSLY